MISVIILPELMQNCVAISEALFLTNNLKSNYAKSDAKNWLSLAGKVSFLGLHCYSVPPMSPSFVFSFLMRISHLTLFNCLERKTRLDVRVRKLWHILKYSDDVTVILIHDFVTLHVFFTICIGFLSINRLYLRCLFFPLFIIYTIMSLPPFCLCHLIFVHMMLHSSLFFK